MTAILQSAGQRAPAMSRCRKGVSAGLVAGVVVSDAGRYVTGQTVVVDAGFTNYR